jgi:integrase
VAAGRPDQRPARGPAPTATRPAPDPATLQRLEDGVTGAGARVATAQGARRERPGLPPITFHALRHTAATLLLAEGEHPKVVQALLGHAQVSITLDRYSHMTPRLMSNAAALMDRLLDDGRPGAQAPDRF